MNEERHSQYCAICWAPVFWDEVAQQTIYTCVCVTKQFKQPTIPIPADWIVGDDSIAFSANKRVEVPQVFYDAFKTKEDTQ